MGLSCPMRCRKAEQRAEELFRCAKALVACQRRRWCFHSHRSCFRSGSFERTRDVKLCRGGSENFSTLHRRVASLGESARVRLNLGRKSPKNALPYGMTRRDDLHDAQDATQATHSDQHFWGLATAVPSTKPVPSNRSELARS